MYLVGSPWQGPNLRLEFGGGGGGVWHFASSTGDLIEPSFPGIRAWVGRGAQQIPRACVGVGKEPEAVWCSLIEYRSQSVPRGPGRLGREGSGTPPPPPCLGTPQPEGPQGLSQPPAPRVCKKAREVGKEIARHDTRVNTVCMNWVFYLC